METKKKSMCWGRTITKIKYGMFDAKREKI